MHSKIKVQDVLMIRMSRVFTNKAHGVRSCSLVFIASIPLVLIYRNCRALNVEQIHIPKKDVTWHFETSAFKSRIHRGFMIWLHVTDLTSRCSRYVPAYTVRRNRALFKILASWEIRKSSSDPPISSTARGKEVVKLLRTTASSVFQ